MEDVSCGDNIVSVPTELFQVPSLGCILNLETWNTLSEEEKGELRSLLPPLSLEDEASGGFVDRLLQGTENVFFGNPTTSYFRDLVEGEWHPRVAKCRAGMCLLHRVAHIHAIREHHNALVEKLQCIASVINDLPEGTGPSARLRAWQDSQKRDEAARSAQVRGKRLRSNQGGPSRDPSPSPHPASITSSGYTPDALPASTSRQDLRRQPSMQDATTLGQLNSAPAVQSQIPLVTSSSDVLPSKPKPIAQSISSAARQSVASKQVGVELLAPNAPKPCSLARTPPALPKGGGPHSGASAPAAALAALSKLVAIPEEKNV